MNFSLFFSIFLILSLSACGNPFARDNEEQETQQKLTLAEASKIKVLYCQQENERLYDARCDEMTFQGVMAAFCYDVKPIDMSTHEYPAGSGKWNRDEETCFEDGVDLGSRSQCSGDGFIPMAHRWISTGISAKDEVDRTIDYLDENDWKCGEGYDGYAKINHLSWLLHSVQEWMEEGAKLTSIVDLDTLYDKLVKAHNEYLVAFHAHAFGRMNGAVADWTMSALKTLVDQNPDSMIFQAVYNRYLDGDQQLALDIIERECPKDAMPYDHYSDWGGSQRAVHCVAAISILEGM